MLISRCALFFGLASFLLNPGFACGGAEPHYQYGEDELRAAVEGDWALSVTRGSDVPLELTLRLEQRTETAASARAPGAAPPLLRAAHACGTRTLLASAHACIDSTEMPLTVGLVAGDPSFEAANLTGTFRVDSLIFDVGLLHLSLGELRLTAHLDGEGVASSVSVDAPLGSSATLERVAP
jgi:hypothetical protein